MSASADQVSLDEPNYDQVQQVAILTPAEITVESSDTGPGIQTAYFVADEYIADTPGVSGGGSDDILFRSSGGQAGNDNSICMARQSNSGVSGGDSMALGKPDLLTLTG